MGKYFKRTATFTKFAFQPLRRYEDVWLALSKTLGSKVSILYLLFPHILT
jgi:hypothetical protein